MSEQPSEEAHTLTFEVETDDPQQLFQYVLNSTDLRDIKRMRIEIEAEEPITLKTPPSDIATDGEAAGEPEPEPEPEEEPEEVDARPVVDGEYSFQEGSSTFAVAKTLYERRDAGFLENKQIQQFIPNEEGVPDSQVSGRLGMLADNGLVERKDHPDDGRKKVYKLTSKGVEAVERALNRYDIAVEAD